MLRLHVWFYNQGDKSWGLMADKQNNNNKWFSKNKRIQGIAQDEKWAMAMTNMTVCSSSKIPQPTSDHPSVLYQIRASGVPISTVYICKYNPPP